MQLRDGSRSQRPGRYREYTGPTNLDRPAFVHDDPKFDAEVVGHCAFPSLDMHHPGPGPSAVWKTRHKLEVAAAKHPVVIFHCDQEESDEEDEESGDEVQVQGGEFDGEEGSLVSSNTPRYSSADDNTPCRLILTVKDMLNLAHGEAGTEHSNIDQDGDTIMESSGQGSGGDGQRPRRFTVSIVRRPRSPDSLPLEPPPSGRRPKTVSLGLRPPRAAIDNDEPPSPQTVSSPVEGDFWLKDIFQSSTDWSRPSYINYDSTDEEIPMVTDIFKTHPNWTDLSSGVKYIIIYDMTQNGSSFTQACSHLGLEYADIVEMIELVRIQRHKIYKNNLAVAQQNSSSIQAWLDQDSPTPREEALLTDFLTENDIKRGKIFLKFMGLPEVAANMGYYLGSSIGGPSREYNIVLNHFREDGWQELIPHFLVGCQDKVEIMWLEWKRLRETCPPARMSIGELLVRMDAPRDTVNPRRLLPDVENARKLESEEREVLGMSEVLPLWLDNFLEVLPDGEIFDFLDGRVLEGWERGPRLADISRQARALRVRAGRYDGWGDERDMARHQMGELVPTDIDAVRVGEAMSPDGLGLYRMSQEQRESSPDTRQSIEDTSGVTGQNDNESEDVANMAQLDARRRADSLSILEPSERLDDAVGRVLKKYQHLIKTPARPTRASLRGPSQSLEFVLQDEVTETPTARQNKKKKVQVDDEDDSDYEEDSHRKKKSPEKRDKDKRNDDTPRATGRPAQSTGGRRSSLDDSPIGFRSRLTERPLQSNAARQSSLDDGSMSVRPLPIKKNKRKIVADDDDYMDEDDVADASSSTSSPTATRSPSITPRPQPSAVGNGGDLPAGPRPTTKRGDHTAELELLANRIASRTVQELADEYSLLPKSTNPPGVAGTGEGSHMPARGRIQTDSTARNDETALSTTDIAIPSQPSVAGLGQSGRSGRGQVGRPSVEPLPADLQVLPTNSDREEHEGFADGQSQPVQPAPEPQDTAREQALDSRPEAVSVLTSPPSLRVAGNEPVRQTAAVPELDPTPQITPRADINIAYHPPDRPSLRSAATISNTLLSPMEGLTSQNQSFSSARFEAPISGAEPPSAVSETPANGRKGKAGKAGKSVIEKEKGSKGKKAQKPGAESAETGEPKPKGKGKRKSGGSLVGEAKVDACDGSKGVPPSTKRLSTTPIPLPVIPGMTLPAASGRKAAGNLGNSNSQGSNQSLAVNTPRSSEPKDLLSEEQIRKLGPKRAELEIYKHREKARSSRGSSIGRSSSPLSGNSMPARGHGSLTAETPSSQLTGQTSVPAASQQTVGSSPHPLMGRHDASQFQSSPPMPSSQGSSERPLPRIRITAPGGQNMKPSARRTTQATGGTITRKNAPGKITIPNKAELRNQTSQAMPSNAPNMQPQAQGPRGAATNANANASGNLQRPSSKGALSPSLNIPESFGGNQTSSYIQSQDQCISQAIGIARERTHGVCLPSGGRRPGAGAGGTVALAEQYNQLMSGQKLQVVGSQSQNKSQTQRSQPQLQNMNMNMASGATPGAVRFQGMLGAGQRQTQTGMSGASSRLSPMPGSNTPHSARLVAGTGTGQRNWPNAAPTGLNNGNANPPQPAQFTAGFPVGNMNCNANGNGNHQPAQPRVQGRNPFSSPMRIPMPGVQFSPEQVQAQLQRQRLARAQLQRQFMAQAQGQGRSPVSGSGAAMGMPQPQPSPSPSPLLLPRASMSMSMSPPQLPVQAPGQVQAQIQAQAQAQAQPQVQAQVPIQNQWPMQNMGQNMDIGQLFLEGSLNDLRAGWDMGLQSQIQIQNQTHIPTQNQLQNQAQFQAQAQQQSDFGLSRSGFQVDNQNQIQNRNQIQDQAQNYTQNPAQAQAQQQPDFGLGLSGFQLDNMNMGQIQNQNQGRNHDQSQDAYENFFQQQMGAASMSLPINPEEVNNSNPNPSHVQAENQSTTTFTDLLGNAGMEFEFGMDLGAGTGADMDTGIGMNVDMGMATGPDMPSGASGELNLNMDVDMDIGAIDPRILGDLGNMGGMDEMGEGDMDMDMNMES